MQEFDPYYSNSMALGGLPTPDPLWIPPLTDDHHGFPAYLAEEDEQLLLDLNGFLSDPTPLLDTADSTNFPPPADNCLFQQFTPPDFQLHYSYDYLLTDYQPPPKRQKCFPDFLPPPPQLVQSCCCTLHGNGNNNVHKRKEPGGAPATAQSLAARGRRKRISNKTMELGKLFPGAESGKMNTAEMLQHAFNYVKFMQSQLSLLQLLPQGIKKENLQIVASSAVQEKLCMKDKCLVPLDLVDQLASDGDLKSQGSISTDLKQLVESVFGV